MTDIRAAIHDVLRDADAIPQDALVEQVAEDVGVAQLVVIDTLDDDLRDGLAYRVQTDDGWVIKRTETA